MKRHGLFLAVILGALLIASPALAQKTILSLDAGASSWAVSAQGGTPNQLLLADFPDDFVEGTGSMQVTALLRGFAASWGTWTDARWNFPTPMDISGYDDLRFDVKIMTPPSVQAPGKPVADTRALQFVVDLYDSTAVGVTLWRYAAGSGDYNMFYSPRTHWLSPANTGWFEVVIPLSRLCTPGWYTPKDPALDKAHIITFGFGVDGDSTAADSVTFLIDNIRATKSNRVGQIASLDAGASKWATSLADPTHNSLTLTDFPDDYVEGAGSMEVDVALRNYGAAWGTWTDSRLDLPAPLDLSGSTELRFFYKVLTNGRPGWNKSIQMTVDLIDSSNVGLSLWRWPAQYGLFAAGLENNAQNKWSEMVIPITDMSIPSWYTPQDSNVNLKAIRSLAFGIHGDSSHVDSVKILLDDFHTTRLVVTGVTELPKNGTPSEFRLEQNYPNPFNPSTRIQYTLGQSGKVSLKIYNMTGQLVQTVMDGVEQSKGRYEANVNMVRQATGVYLYVLQQGSQRIAKLMTLIK